LKNIRLIARLDIKGQNLIKGIHLEGLRVVGNPNEKALEYYNKGIDELLYMDVVASLYGRNHLSEIIRSSVNNIFVPITVGGGIRSVEDVSDILKSGADKIAINTAAVKNPELISKIAYKYGSQCVVISIEAKRNVEKNMWEVYTDNGREKTGINVMDWVQKVEKMGAGELLITSIDQEGTKKGFDLMLYKNINEITSLPVIASGGMGKHEDLIQVVNQCNVDAVAVADILHYKRTSINEIKNSAKLAGLNMR